MQERFVVLRCIAPQSLITTAILNLLFGLSLTILTQNILAFRDYFRNYFRNHLLPRMFVIVGLLCLHFPLYAQQTEALTKSTDATIGQSVINALNTGAASLNTLANSITIGTVTLGTIEATVSKFFQFSPSLPDSVGSFLLNFITPLADTNRAEYAGIYTHFRFGGGLSGFEQNLSSYPSIRNVATPLDIRTNTAEFRTVALGLTTDTPILYPFFRSRKKAKATGFRWGMNLELQITDGRLLGTSNAARYRLGDGTIVPTTASVQHGGFLTLASLGFAPTLRYAFASGLSLQAGLHLGLTFSSRWTVEDSVFVPNRTLLLETNAGRRLENYTGSQIEQFSINPVSLMVGLGYTLALDRSFHLRPELVMIVPFGEASWWNRPSLRAGLSVLLNTEKIIPTPDTTFIRDTTIIVTASNEAPRTVLLQSNSIVQPSLYPNDEPAKVFVSESYQRRLPKPKPLLSASVDAEFVLPTGQRKRNVMVESEKTAVSLIPLIPPDTLNTVQNLHIAALQEYFAQHNLRLKPLQNSTLPILTDTLFLAGALPNIVFTPRVVSEADIRGFDLALWRTKASNTNTRLWGKGDIVGDNNAEYQIALFRDTSSILAPKPLLWKAAEIPEAFIRPDERIIYRFRVFDEDFTPIPADSGFISLRSDNRISLDKQSVKRNITIYAFSPGLYALYEEQPHLLNALTSSEPLRIRIFSSETFCRGASTNTDTERLVALLRRIIPSARFDIAPCLESPAIPSQKQSEGSNPAWKHAAEYLFVMKE
jgi:hypothetical protein